MKNLKDSCLDFFMIKKGDWIELDFSARVDGKLFDTTRYEEAAQEKLISNKERLKPLIICVGEGMVIKGLDRALEGKEIGREYEIELKPEEAFGQRNPALIQTIPLSAFKEKPEPSSFVSINGIVAKVITVTGGRVLVDFNSPLAGKKVSYSFKINCIINDQVEKVKALANWLGLKLKSVKIQENTAIIKLEKDKAVPELFEQKIEQLFGLKLKIDV